MLSEHFTKKILYHHCLIIYNLEMGLILFLISLHVTIESVFDFDAAGGCGIVTMVGRVLEICSFENEKNVIVGIAEIKFAPFNGCIY